MQAPRYGSQNKLRVGIDAGKAIAHFVQIFDGFDGAVEMPNTKQSTDPSADPTAWFK